ncbi:G-protein coupled receptor 135 [Tachyglossus aculeatus]|uniref:G-protein coupled receptor 135 n=1 Tax=Tachyglossus aculeatus TaxID=9261 RepID=UPI0018F46146|nr:G-protein coupled receptor 135 [Tachyglossus aculeatus]
MATEGALRHSPPPAGSRAPPAGPPGGCSRAERTRPAEAGAAAGAVAAQALVLLLIFLLSSLGNLAVMGVIVKHRPLRTVTNAFILSLSLSDLLTALLCLPAAFLALLAGAGPAWPPGSAGPWARFCAAGRFFSSCFGIVSTLTLSLISLDRYYAIVRRPREKMGRRRALQLLGAVWLLAVGLSVPWDRLRAGAGPGPHGCLYGSRPGPAYGLGLTVACYLLPFALMCFCHYHICRTVRRSETRVRPLTTYAHLLRFYGELRTATTVLIMIVFAIACWGPACLLGLLAAAKHPPRFPPALDTLAVWLTWANGAINPLIYALRNPNLSVLLGRGREDGYRTRNVAAYLSGWGRGPGPGGRLREGLPAARWAARGRRASAGPTHGGAAGPAGEVALWACRNPAMLFCREGRPDAETDKPALPKAEAADTSL